MSDGGARRLEGAGALVTGAARGIGLAVARRLAAEGAGVTMTDVRAADLRAAAERVGRGGGRVSAEPADLGDRRERAGLVDAAVQRWGGLDVLVNNAAIQGPRTSFLEMDLDAWDQVLEVNLTATAALCQQAARHMAGRGSGAIVNVVSIQQDLPLPSFTAYVASKGGVGALTRSLAVELSPLGVRVNAVAPGVIATEGLRDVHGAADGRTATLLGRSGTADEVAGAVAYLASPESSFVTGAVLHVDGGRRLSRLPDPLGASGAPDAGSGA